MVASGENNDTNYPKIRKFLPLFERARQPNAESGDWSEWISLLSSENCDSNNSPSDAMFISKDKGFGTVCSALIALKSSKNQEVRSKFWFIKGQPTISGYKLVGLN